MTFRFLSPALKELAEAAEFYDARVPGLGADFISEFDRAMDLILKFPKTWSVLSEGFQHFSLRRFPYSIVYAIEGETEVLVVSVFHQSRKPGSWRDNL